MPPRTHPNDEPDEPRIFSDEQAIPDEPDEPRAFPQPPDQVSSNAPAELRIPRQAGSGQEPGPDSDLAPSQS
jgi:hypothetical protein